MRTASCRDIVTPEFRRFFDEVATQVTLPVAAPPFRPEAPIEQQQLDYFFDTIRSRVAIERQRQQEIDLTEATRFNVFDLIEPDENKLSDILADLMNPTGSHGQGDLFVRSLFQELGFGASDIDGRTPTVRREALTHGIVKSHRRMDVLVEAGVLLAFENKVDSMEQLDQVKDYLQHLRYCVSAKPQPFVLVYLTPNGRPPKSLHPDVLKFELAERHLRCWSYRRELRAWLDACRRKCAARRIQDFLSDFIRYIDSTMKYEPDPSND